jgi:hypothetical protein
MLDLWNESVDAYPTYVLDTVEKFAYEQFFATTGLLSPKSGHEWEQWSVFALAELARHSQ